MKHIRDKQHKHGEEFPFWIEHLTVYAVVVILLLLTGDWTL